MFFIQKYIYLFKNMIPIEYGGYYHIFNRGNNYENIFLENEDYSKFLEYTNIFITSIAEIYAWALLGNHFHFLLKIKDENEIGYLNSNHANSDDLMLKWKTVTLIDKDHKIPNKLYARKPSPTRQINHLFSSYTKWFNSKYNRTGSLFTKNFQRKKINDEKYLRNLIIYIHQNPIHHDFCKQLNEYRWTSYLSVLSSNPTKINRKDVLTFFDDAVNFKYVHTKKYGFESIDDLIIE